MLTVIRTDVMNEPNPFQPPRHLLSTRISAATEAAAFLHSSFRDLVSRNPRSLAVGACTWTVVAGLYSLALCLSETALTLGGGCGTCAAEAQFSLFVVCPVLLCTSFLSTLFVHRIGSNLFRFARLICFATVAVVVTPICTILIASWL